MDWPGKSNAYFQPRKIVWKRRELSVGLQERHALANSLLIEYTNTFDAWYLGPGKGGIIGDIDSMLQMTQLSYSTPGKPNAYFRPTKDRLEAVESRTKRWTPGSWNDADMLQVCAFGKGASPGGGMTLTEYRAHYSVWAILGENDRL